MNRWIGLMLAAGVVALPMASGAQSTGRHSYTIPHTLRFAGAEDLVGLNPMLNQQAVLSYLSQMTMAYLVRYDEHNEPIPELATVVPSQKNGGVSADGKTITYHLRGDAKWSDGVPFTSEDVRFSIKAVLNPKNNTGGTDGFDKIVRMDTPNATTIVLHLKQPYGGFVGTYFSAAGGGPSLLPKHILGNLPDINNAPYNALPIGIGPFKYASWKRGDSVELVPNPTYFGRKPKLQHVIYKLITDRNTVLTQLTTHELDLWIPATAAYYDRLKGIPGVTVLNRPGYTYDHMDFNVSHGALRDPVVRRALRYGIDRKLLLEKIRHGVGVLQEGMLAPTHPNFDPSIKLIPFDIAKGNALLDKAGYVRGADGIRAKAGVRLSFDYATAVGTPDADQQIELIRSWWKEMGVDFTVHRYLSAIFFAPAQTGGTLYGGHFDIANFAWGGTPDGDQTNIFASDRVPPHGQNVLRYHSPVTDRLMAQFSATYDLAKRKKLSAQIQEQIVRDAPTIVLDVRDDIEAFNSDLKNFKPNTLTPFDNAANFDI